VPAVDLRFHRVEQGIFSVALLAGYVFGWWWAPIPVALLLLGDLALGDQGPALWSWQRFVAPRISRPAALEEPGPFRMQSLLLLALLVLAALVRWLGLDDIADLLTIVTAIVCALAAVGVLCVGCELYERRARR
jgi:hypothetical protein